MKNRRIPNFPIRARINLARQAALPLGLLLAAAVQAEGPDMSLLERAQQTFESLPSTMATAEFPTPAARVALGRKLFFDRRLSVDGTVSCANCHYPALYGADGLPKSIGVEHRLNARNAPTVLNAALQFKSHWIGDRANVEEQALKALAGRTSFGNADLAAAAARIKALPGYSVEFRQVFPDDPEPVTPENWGKAIGAYERTLVSPSPFDAYLKGKTEALSSEARTGLKLFMETGCAFCHKGVGVGGASFEKFGVFGDYWKETGSQPIDEGRFSITRQPADKYVFKIPSLRNVAMTSPYFHDGSVADLSQAIRIMAKLQLGKDLADAEIRSIAAFLGSLTGELPRNFAEPTATP